MTPEEIWIGQAVSVGAQDTRKANVCGPPYEFRGRWYVPCQMLNGVRQNVPLSLIRKRHELKDLVKAVAPDVTDEELGRIRRKWWVG